MSFVVLLARCADILQMQLRRDHLSSGTSQTTRGRFNNALYLKEDYLRLIDIAPYYRIQVAISCGHKERYKLVEFDHCEGYTEYNTANLRMQRRRVKEVFDSLILRRWLQKCDAKNPRTYDELSYHNLNALVDETRLRGLDVYSGEVKILDLRTPYVTLSHLWGQTHSHKMFLRPDKQPNKQVPWRISLDDLPTTIKDAVILVRELDQQFLWVDGLCIDQADEAAKTAIISKMEAIYSKAYLTIEATGGEDANAGLRRMWSSGCPPEQPVSFTSRKRRFSLLPARVGCEKAIECTKWNTRGWTYQEHVLSSRSVIFTDYEVFFSGYDIYEREAFRLKRIEKRKHPRFKRRTGRQLSTKDAFARREHPHRRLLYRYFRAVEEYSQRILSYPSDRLNAFSGILQFFTNLYRSSSKFRSFGGLLENAGFNTFLGCLHWQPALRSNDRMIRIAPDAAKSRALPSWSWAGWLGEITFDPGLNTWGFELLNLLDAIRLDENNVVATRRVRKDEEPWKPQVSSLTPSEGFVLHLWCPVLLCRLRARDVGDDSGLQLSGPYRLFEMVDACTENPIVYGPRWKHYRNGWNEGFVADEHLVSAAATAESLHEVVCVGKEQRDERGQWTGSFMLVKRMQEERCNGRFYERIAITAFVDSYGFVNEDIRLDYRHVMLI